MDVKNIASRRINTLVDQILKEIENENQEIIDEVKEVCWQWNLFFRPDYEGK